MAEGKITLPPDSTGKNLDVTELTRIDGTVVERQRFDLGDGTNLAGLVSILQAQGTELRRLRAVLEFALGQPGLGDVLVRGETL